MTNIEEVTASEKRSSLLRHRINCGRKKFHGARTVGANAPDLSNPCQQSLKMKKKCFHRLYEIYLCIALSLYHKTLCCGINKLGK